MANFDQHAFNQFIIENGVYGFFEKAITLKSGRKSHFYANWRNVVEDAWLTERLVEFVLSYINDENIAVDTFYGVPEGATKLGVLTQYAWAKSQNNYSKGSHVLAMGRAKPKEHGAPRDRFFVGMPQGKVVILEDVTTTGGSLLNTVDYLYNAEVDITAVISLTNRREKRDDGLGVKELFDNRNIPFYNMSSAIALLPIVYKKLNPGESIACAIESEYRQYGEEAISIL